MLIVDVQASDKLYQAIKYMPAMVGRYCLQFKPLDEACASYPSAPILAAAEKFLPGSDLYITPTGEAYLLTARATPRDCRKVLHEVATVLDRFPAERVGDIIELDVQRGPFLVNLERKIEQQVRNEEILRLQIEEKEAYERTMRKRFHILEMNAPIYEHNIAARRKSRQTPELMIIEDDAFSRRLVENVLKKDFNLNALESAEDAIASYIYYAPDVLFLDINLPDVTGHELLKKIIAIDPEAYVVMLSGNADKQNIIQAMSCGAVGFVAKPFTSEKLLQYIDRCPTIRKEVHHEPQH